ncbi:similar to Saccharomyces cerevisiae YJL044C GYP6 GTPase-activating protein (GAP) for the yeast Rab family member, Ypt6p [Maudiozyma saulgeensis]|uniref:Similar to Saccharomyces cerevisiae YJL044C GYP6 GTPase-activating protein (GAP) for the yeast Rab family member, Ypt6p n=1 Tax=Maudiozyma saulgeensis TaxID=1789683 RepID=A0A1X7R5B7_9SACH|nr:similar to Saccharomyces cerevisiae YJL044C GYP6 GTPase-activating protein (GAP) for the yeast Rab family member, Ypt6p [Kazachstania saulgeensis]
MTELTQLIIDTYKTREQLIQNGIWGGELYKHVKIINNHDRSWIWKTLLLHSENQDDSNKDKKYITNDSFLFDSLDNLVPVPLLSPITKKNEDADQLQNTTLAFTPIKQIVKIGNKGIRKLTPKETHLHPLTNHEDEDDYGMNISDTLEIIDLDLSRLIVSPIFQDPKVHALMRQIMFNYLLLTNEDKQRKNIPIVDQIYRYRQGFHEILSIIFLQFYDSNLNNIEIKFILFIFIKLMVPLQRTFYIEKNLLNWQNNYFIKLLKLSSPQIYSIFYPTTTNTNHTNLIWLIRWTRLLFLRELPIQDCLIVWDHILTFSYPVDSMVACIIIAILITVRKNLIEIYQDNEMDNDDLIEFMLQFDKHIKNLNILKICELAGSLCESWENGNWKDLSKIVTNYINQNEMDPNRKRLEDKLKQRVQRSLNK